MMKLTLALSITLCTAYATARSPDQALLTKDNEQAATLDLIYEQAQPTPCDGSPTMTDTARRLKKAEIIPTVIDTFKPFLTVNVTWPKASANYGNTINPAKTQDTPQIRLNPSLPDSLWTREKIPQLTLALTDPDAPSRDNPEWSEICHWIATNVKLAKDSSSLGVDVDLAKDWKEIVPYKPPGPPPKTGKHRYVFVALAPVNGTTESLDLRKPEDRQHWGYDDERQGLRKWAEENGLAVVGANFIYEKNDKQ